MSALTIDVLFDVKGQVAVVTGGTGVLGGMMAEGLAANGAYVVVLGRSAEKGRALVERIEAAGGVAVFYVCDVTSRSSCEKVAAGVVADRGQIDVLVNCAGGNHPGATATPEQPFYDLTDEGFRHVTDLNILGTVLPCQVFGKVMADKGAGNIVNISSLSASQPLTKVMGYGLSKAAIDNLTKWLCVYMHQNVGEHLRVNAIAPGFFLTEQNRFLLTDESTGDFTPRGRCIVDHTPMGRLGQADELVGTLLWLCSPAARFVSGTVIPVDGGFSAFSGV